MSSSTLGKVVQRAISDAAFRRQLQTDPQGALRGFDLSADEASALRSGDPAKLTALGIDQRMSKAYQLGDSLNTFSRVNIPGATGGTDTVLDDAHTGARDMPLVSGSGHDQDALISSGDITRTAADSGDDLSGARDAATAGSGGPSGDMFITADETGHLGVAGRGDEALTTTDTGDAASGTAFITADEQGHDYSVPDHGDGSALSQPPDDTNMGDLPTHDS